MKNKVKAADAMTALLPGEVDQAQIDRWKTEKRSESIHKIIVSTPEGEKRYYLSEPDDMIYSQAMTLMGNKQIVKAGEALLNACYLGGHPLPDKSQRTLYRTLCIQATTTIEFYETENAKH